jgi:hypothetical protein
VTSVEHSGLESILSEEVVAGRTEKRTVFLECERARLSHHFWVAFRGDAGDLHYVWMRAKEGTGTATFSLSPSQVIPGPCTLWARVKGEQAARFTVRAGKRRVTLPCEPGKSWRWVKADEPIDLEGQKDLEVSTSTYGSAMDCLALSSDVDFNPGRASRIAWPALPAPKGLTVAARSPFVAELSWEVVPTAMAHHYNVYCSPDRKFQPNQAYLVASPDRTKLVDWGLRSGQQLFYRVTAVDRAGNESPACEPVAVQLPEVRRTLLVKDFSPEVEFAVQEGGLAAR